MPTIKTIELPDDWKPGICGQGNPYCCPFSKRGCWVRLPENCPLAPKVCKQGDEGEQCRRCSMKSCDIRKFYPDLDIVQSTNWTE